MVELEEKEEELEEDDDINDEQELEEEEDDDDEEEEEEEEEKEEEEDNDDDDDDGDDDDDDDEEKEEEDNDDDDDDDDDDNEEEIEVLCKVICPRSHPDHPHTLSFRTGKAITCYSCGNQSGVYYYCTTCDVRFKKDCPFHSNKIRHPYHLQHPLTYIRLNTESEINNTIQTQSPFIFDACSWCGNKPDIWVYSCYICSFCLCVPCSKNTPPLTIANPKSHHHPLLFLPRPLLVPCDACGLVRASEASYTCFQCNYMVHESCMSLPRVIKLTRHSHRLSFTPFLPPSVLSCGVCYRAVDVRFGQYSCDHEDCFYVVHSKCATHDEVWDGRELEWEPESQEEAEDDVASFKKVGGDLIKYFSHDHHLKLENYDGVRDAKKQCEACILPIDPRCFYSCTQCDYSLHEVCAGLPRKLDHPLHKHCLALDHAPLDDYDYMNCSTCFRTSSGFRYKCIEGECKLRTCHIDLRCILIPECTFTHKSHEHPLFISVSYGLEGGPRCYICGKGCARAILRCSKCAFTMCFRCATIPTELHYKHDRKHHLSLCYGEGVDDVGKYWCEICEMEVDSKKWFYMCNQCCITVHRECIFNSSIYMKSGSTFDWNGYLVRTDSTNSPTRQICAICEERCTFSVCYTLILEEGWDDKALCSFRCLRAAMWRIFPEDM
ncbi:uncharacterized protein LOC103870383 [Brassica rapa]|uniref:Zinc finger PHD-type domain-containing protein n=1 Tax=Brassica campestris TaxID=3711 RepID=M4F0W2_BRACM|nr:uncharacterized protein LOC103870383 [Brassica rapa]